MNAASPLQLRVLAEIKLFRRRNHGNSPSHKEVAEAIGLEWKNTVKVACEALEAKGLLKKIGARKFLVPADEIPAAPAAVVSRFKR